MTNHDSGAALMEELISYCLGEDAGLEFGTPYSGLTVLTAALAPEAVREVSHLLRELASEDDDELERRMDACWGSLGSPEDDRHVLKAMAAFLDTGERDPAFEWYPDRVDAAYAGWDGGPVPPAPPGTQWLSDIPGFEDLGPPPAPAPDLGGRWTVSSSFDTIDEANLELQRALRTEPDLVRAHDAGERPDLPTLRHRLPTPLGRVILNDGTVVPGQTAVVVLRRKKDGHSYLHTGYLEAEVDDPALDPRHDYPLLHLFLDGYLHQDWRDDYGDWQTALGEFLLLRTDDERHAFVDDVRRVLQLDPAARTAIVVRCHSYVVPSREGGDDGEWLETMADFVRRAASQQATRTGKRRRRGGRRR